VVIPVLLEQRIVGHWSDQTTRKTDERKECARRSDAERKLHDVSSRGLPAQQQIRIHAG
jgi:hypothetical protein